MRGRVKEFVAGGVALGLVAAIWLDTAPAALAAPKAVACTSTGTTTTTTTVASTSTSTAISDGTTSTSTAIFDFVVTSTVTTTTTTSVAHREVHELRRQGYTCQRPHDDDGGDWWANRALNREEQSIPWSAAPR
jgi:hypothetical protein